MSEPGSFNFTTDVVERLARERGADEALRAIDSAGAVESFTFARGRRAAGRVSGGLVRARGRPRRRRHDADGRPARLGVRLLGSMADRRGRAALLGAAPPQGHRGARSTAARPSLVLAAGRDMEELTGEALERRGPRPCATSTPASCRTASPANPSATGLEDPALMIFTSGTAGEPRGGRARPALPARDRRPRPSTGSAPARASSPGARRRSGWSKSARNAFVAPWTMGAACLIHEGRFDPAERLDSRRGARRERALPVSDRVPDDRQARRAARPFPALRRLVSAGEPLNPEVIEAFERRSASRSTTGTGRPRPGS